MRSLIQKLKKMGVVSGMLISVAAMIGVLYSFHKNFFLTDVRAEFNNHFMSKSEGQILSTKQDILLRDFRSYRKEYRQDLKVIQTDIKQLLKEK